MIDRIALHCLELLKTSVCKLDHQNDLSARNPRAASEESNPYTGVG